MQYYNIIYVHSTPGSDAGLYTGGDLFKLLYVIYSGLNKKKPSMTINLNGRLEKCFCSQ
jgi:hypothetical protein